MGAHSNLGVYSDAQEIAADAASTSTVDHSQPVNLNQYGVSGRLWLCIRVAVAPTVTTDSLSIDFQMDADDGAGDPAGTWYSLFMPLADAEGAEYVASAEPRILTAGAWIWRAPLPMEMVERHTRLYYENTTSTGTQTIDAWLNDGPPQSDFDKQVFVSPVGNP